MPLPRNLYAGYPSTVVYGEKVAGKTKGKKPRNHLIWGDWITVNGKEGDWWQVAARGTDGWVHEDSVQEERVLEVNFIDVGQGDGCHIVTPKDRHILIDAGAESNMYRFLRWRFRGFKKTFTFESAIITHPDKDHYGGFRRIFEEPKVKIDTVYHNGIVERVAAKRNARLGPRPRDPGNKVFYLTGLCPDLGSLKALVGQAAKRGKKRYPNLMHMAATEGRVQDMRMLSAEDGHLPGYDPAKPLTIQVLGPVGEPDPAGKPRLRWFKDVGKTKNGHSVILKLVYDKVTCLLGGDLNTESEDYLLEHYTGLAQPPKSAEDETMTVSIARHVFECDCAKACHHGSPHFRNIFLRAVNAAATVVSSGDEESYAHPRPDALGALGKYGRGSRPLIFSTELARSTKDSIKQPHLLRQDLVKKAKAIDAASTSADKDKALKRYKDALRQLERSVARYGMINLRSDGEKVLIAQKLEKQRSAGARWDIHLLEPGPDGRLRSPGPH
ncbi:MAG: hypothetical protein OEU09_14170 [Rhodospirillales bacterium]|nr:hypothetical protein [Rhodospirillales bacterium]MDH3790365.1 hypothetical protein [Rhodospirillales bacterium]MDH3912434.1 hypothetical protein [Rhodospirillales bacterium]MDH3917491.1 hypothetical protein [Rhodospirillales bacterium]MDH3967213.1 hypothetical protein [Rhodospirillales bacterium]